MNQLDNIYILTGQSIRKAHPASIQRSLSDVFTLIQNPAYQGIVKEDRWFFSQSITDIRPTLTTSYQSWSGVLVIDLDIKNKLVAPLVKSELHRLLSKQPWFVGTVLSTSHSGVHVYTACQPDRALFDQEKYMDHFESMSIYVYSALLMAYEQAKAKKTLSPEDLLDMHPELNVSSRRANKDGSLSESQMYDLATARLTQPTLLGYDPEPLLNQYFELLPPLAFSEDTYKNLKGCEFLKAKFDKKRGRLDSQAPKDIKVLNVELPELEQCMPRSYDNTARYRLAYTLANLYDVSSKTTAHYKLIHDCFMRMCSGNPKYEREKQAFSAVFDSAVQRQAVGMSPLIAWAVNELKTIHHFKLETENSEEAEKQIQDVDFDLELSKPVQIPLELQIQYDAIYELGDGQYIADGTSVLMQNLKDPGSKTLLIAEPGTGKTVFATNLMSQTELRVLCIVPYISVIESKFKTLSPEAQCQCVYGMNSYDITLSRNAVMTFDKFSKMSMTDLDMCFDIIILDESHLLQMSSYRSLVPAECVDRLRATRTPTVLMTGTPIAEHMFVTFTQKVMFKRNRATDKLFSLVVCNNPAEKFAQACLHIANAVKHGRKVIMPTNEGNSYVEKVVAAVQGQVNRSINFQYYKKEYADQAFMFDVNRSSTLGDIELLFCSSYLSVGVDINDFDKFDIVYTEDFTAHEIEQFNNRLRRVDLASYYFIAKYANDGYVRPNCLAKITPNLRISKLRQLELQDLLNIQKVEVGEDGQVSRLFDYFTRHMWKPWLMQQANGDVKLHATCYGLWMFEESWRKWAVQVPILVQQLRDYNYQIEVINTELLDSDSLSEILESGREGLHDYKESISDDIQFVIKLLQNKDFYDVLVYSNTIVLKRRNYQGFEAAHIDKDNPAKTRYNLYVEHISHVQRFIAAVRMLSKYYVRQTVLDLYDKNCASIARFEQVEQTVHMLEYASNDRLSTSNVDALTYVLHDMFNYETEAKFSKLQMQVHISKIADIYKQAYDIQSPVIMDKVCALAATMIKRLATQMTKSKGDTSFNVWKLKKIPRFDSSLMTNLNAQKRLMYMMFKASIFETNKDKKTSDEVKVFFRSKSGSDEIKQADQVDVYASLERLESCVVTKQLQYSDRNRLIRYLTSRYPEITTEQVTYIISQLDIESGTSLSYQADKFAKSMHLTVFVDY